MWIKPVHLTGRVAHVVPLAPSHAPDLFAAADRELFRFTPQAPPEWSIAGFERDIEHVTNLPGVVPFAILDSASGRAIGRTTFMDILPEHRGAEIGRTWIGRAFHATRVNPEIKFLMLRHAFEELSPPAIRVAFTTGGSNLHSQAAIAKLGAVREGVLRHNRLVPDGPDPDSPRIKRDTVHFSILADEWASVKRGLMARIGWGNGSPPPFAHGGDAR